MKSSKGAILRKLATQGLTPVPGVYDALTARIVQDEGFKAVYMTGSGSAVARLGAPDIGLLTMDEMVDNAARIADAVDLPVISDADTGYGGPMNVRRTVRAFERAGVAAIHIEDQEFPKRCGHFDGKRVIQAEDMVQKLRAALDARESDDFVIIARTDAYSVEGFEGAMRRAKMYQEAGADMVFVEELRSIEELAAVPRTFSVPALFNVASSGKTPFLSVTEMGELGFKFAIYPNYVQRAVIAAAQTLWRELRENGTFSPETLKKISSPKERLRIVGIDEYNELSARYDSSHVAAGY
jgi:2-methylisocitrate lyase-like PEP mutase family enzyme